MQNDCLGKFNRVTTGNCRKVWCRYALLIAQAIKFCNRCLCYLAICFKKILLTIREREKKIADSLKNADRRSNWKSMKPQKSNRMKPLEEASLEAKKNGCRSTGTGQILYRGTERGGPEASGGNRMKRLNVPAWNWKDREF